MCPSSVETLPTVSRLAQEFESHDVRYVHWKSNINLGEALAGRTDLDLLIHPDDAGACEAVIERLGFARVLTVKDKWQTHIYHYYCPDLGSGRMVHLHLHYALTLGYDYHKNWTLDIVDWYLEGRTRVSGIAVPEVEREYILFIIRLLIKNARSVSVAEFPRRQMQWLLRRPSAHVVIPDSDRKEFAVLAQAADPAKVAQVLATLGLGIHGADLSQYAAVIARGESRRAVHSSARRLKASLVGQKQSGEAVSVLLSLSRLNAQRGRQVLAHAGWNQVGAKTAADGGRIIAFLGGDGAGKSTNVSALSRSLVQAVHTETVHIGRPDRGATATLTAIVGRLAGLWGRSAESSALMNVSLAMSRRAAFRRAERFRDRGWIVVLDRLPQPQLSAMDSPRIRDPSTIPTRALAQLEQKFYQKIRGVDLAVILRLDPEIALERRPGDDQDTLRERSGEVWNGDWTEPFMRVIDSGVNDLDAVRQAALEAAWTSVRSQLVRCEVVGPTGSGKSLATAMVRDRHSNVRTVLPYRRYPVIVAKAVAAQALTDHRSFRRSEFAFTGNLVRLRIFVALEAHWRRSRCPPANNFVLDQGPVFNLAIAVKEGRLRPGDKLFDAAVEAIDRWLSEGVIMLSVPDAVRHARVRHRVSQMSRTQTFDENELSEFDEGYRAAFTTVLERLPNVFELVPDGSVRDVAELIENQIRIGKLRA